MTAFNEGFNEGYERGFDAGYKTASDEKTPDVSIHKTNKPLLTLTDILSIITLIGVCYLITAFF